MRAWIGVWVGLLVPAFGAAAAAEPYEGLWASTPKACRDPDGADRLEITGRRFFWYETRCTARDVRAAGPSAWTMRMSCDGEGRRFTVRPRLSLPAPDRLVMENGPVGPDPKRQTYGRCAAR